MTDSTQPIVRKINPPGLLPPPGNMHAHVVMAPPGAQLAFLAGNVALDEAGTLIGANDYYEQAVQVFKNIKIAVEGVGGKPENIVQLTIFIVGYKDHIIEDINRAGKAAFGDGWPVTATTLLGVEALAASDFLIEVNAIAAI